MERRRRISSGVSDDLTDQVLEQSIGSSRAMLGNGASRILLPGERCGRSGIPINASARGCTIARYGSRARLLRRVCGGCFRRLAGSRLRLRCDIIDNTDPDGHALGGRQVFISGSVSGAGVGLDGARCSARPRLRTPLGGLFQIDGRGWLHLRESGRQLRRSQRRGLRMRGATGWLIGGGLRALAVKPSTSPALCHADAPNPWYSSDSPHSAVSSIRESSLTAATDSQVETRANSERSGPIVLRRSSAAPAGGWPDRWVWELRRVRRTTIAPRSSEHSRRHARREGAQRILDRVGPPGLRPVRAGRGHAPAGERWPAIVHAIVQPVCVATEFMHRRVEGCRPRAHSERQGSRYVDVSRETSTEGMMQ